MQCVSALASACDQAARRRIRGDLFPRERPQARLTELGQRMYPLLKQCYESALGAKSLTSSLKSGEIGTLKLALSRTINLRLLTSHLSELSRLFSRT